LQGEKSFFASKIYLLVKMTNVRLFFTAREISFTLKDKKNVFLIVILTIMTSRKQMF